MFMWQNEHHGKKNGLKGEEDYDLSTIVLANHARTSNSESFLSLNVHVTGKSPHTKTHTQVGFGVAAVQRLASCIEACCGCYHSTTTSFFSRSPSNTHSLSPTLTQSYFLLSFCLTSSLSLSCSLSGFHGDSCALQKSHWSENEIEGASLFCTWTHEHTRISFLSTCHFMNVLCVFPHHLIRWHTHTPTHKHTHAAHVCSHVAGHDFPGCHTCLRTHLIGLASISLFVIGSCLVRN